MKAVKTACIVLASIVGGGGASVWAADRGAAVKHLVYLNPFVVQKFAQEAVANGYVAPEVPKGLEMPERLAYVKKHLEAFKYSPGVEAVKEIIVSNYKLQDVGETLTAIPAFYAQLSDEQLIFVEKSGLVSYVETISADENDITLSAIPVDVNVAGETITWAKQAINRAPNGAWSGVLDDGITTSNQVYVVDMAYNNTALSGEIDLSFTDNGTQAPLSLYEDHPAHIFSLVGARSNYQKIRGINPGQPLVHIGSEPIPATLISKVLYASSLAEWVDDFASMSLSFNHYNQNQVNIFNHNEVGGRALRRASARLFIAQSAGNSNINACSQAFNFGPSAKAFDGIVVTGGVDKNGARFLSTANPPGWGAVAGSSYGSCIEAWAPGHQITSTRADGAVQTMTGTSFAAPIVAALAARYGNSTTRPIEREAYIKNSLIATGSYENAGASNLPIMHVAYTNPASSNIPKRLPISTAYSVSSTANLNMLYDQKFFTDTFWNAGGNWGSVVVDLGSAKNITGVRLHMRSSANGGAINFAVHGGNTINLSGPGTPSIPANPIAYSNVDEQFDLVPYYIYLSGSYRYLMIEGYNFNSWLAYSEIEVYGN